MAQLKFEVMSSPYGNVPNKLEAKQESSKEKRIKASLIEIKEVVIMWIWS